MRINAVFEGGGVKGISLVGAVHSAEQHGMTFNRVAGTSSGSIVASFLAAGYTAEEMERLILEMPFSSFLQRAPIFQIKWIGPAVRLLWKKGLYSGEALEKWVHDCLLKKGIRTFGDLKKEQLRIIASDITNGRLMVLPDDIANYGIDPASFLVSKAIRMSTSIPYFFDPVILRAPFEVKNGRTKKFADQFSYIVDGGMLSNFPLWLFDDEVDPRSNRLIPTIGFQMVGKQSGQPHQITGLITMLQAMVSTMISAHDQRYIDKENRFRTIKIPTLGIGTTDFDLTVEQSMALYESGEKAGDAYFEQWTRDAYEKMYKVHCCGKTKI